MGPGIEGPIKKIPFLHTVRSTRTVFFPVEFFFVRQHFDKLSAGSKTALSGRWVFFCASSPASGSSVGSRDGANEEQRRERPADLRCDPQASLTLSGVAAPD